VAATVIARRQPAVPGWRQAGQALVRDFSFRDFDQAFAFATRIAEEAVDFLRRPDISVFGFNRVRLRIANPHRAGLTEAELRLARKVDALLAEDAASQGAAADGSGRAESNGAQRAGTDGRAFIPPRLSAVVYCSR
jgi:pterin-4a-carbinolamine dehydratase